MKLLLSLNEGVRSLGNRFDTYQNHVEAKFDKVNAELVLMKNRVDMLEQNSRREQLQNQSSQHQSHMSGYSMPHQQ